MSTSERYFDDLGGDWEALRSTFFSPAVREQALARAGVEAGALAADVGAGTGYVTEALVERGARVIAVDRSVPMLEALAARFPPSAGVDCRRGEAEALPVQDSAVEHVFANMLLHHVESPPAALREMVRILEPGGVLVVSDLDAHDFEHLATEQHDRWLGFERDRIRAWLIEAGLVDVRVDCAGEECRATSVAGEVASVGIFIASGRKGGRPER